jgi:serine/threonine protein phosphatase PrpC
MSADEKRIIWRIIGQSIRGASHQRNGIPVQDAIQWFPDSGAGPPLGLAIADGHGSASSFRSHTGAEFAVAAATSLFREFERSHDHQEISRIRQAATRWLPRELVRKWKQTVNRHIEENPLSPPVLRDLEQRAGPSARSEVETDPLLAYGSTILGVLATHAYLLYIQLGDGDILMVSASGEVRRPWPRDERFLGVETASLCAPDSWKEARIGVQRISDKTPELLLVCTDGYANSFREDAGFLSVGRDILEMVRSEGLERVSESLGPWLAEASQLGSGDDITLGVLHRTLPTAAGEP